IPFESTGPAPRDDDGLQLTERLGLEDENLDKVELQDLLDQAMRHLTPRERRIMYLRFVDELPQAEVAKRLGISQMHVSRLQRAFAQAGGRSLIDMTVDGLDPKPEALRRISQRSGVQIVMGTGVYRAFAHPPWVAGMTVDELAARFVGAIQVGINGTDVRAGLLGELGTSSPILPDEVKVLRAAARAHFKTGVSINVHPAIFHREGPRILDVLE